MSGILEKIWYREAPLWAKTLEGPLALASVAYGLGMRWDHRRKTAGAGRLPKPVLSVGNLTVGGTGKTPVVRFLAETAIEQGARVCILSRGYGANRGEPRKVDPQEINWEVYGDEPLLLARALPTASVWVGKDRCLAGLKALEDDPSIDLFLLDDGFQHHRMKRDFDLVLVDGNRGFGNRKLLPWGPMREPVSALDRADRIAIVTKEDSRGGFDLVPEVRPPSFRIDLRVAGWSVLGCDRVRPLADLPRSTPFRLVSGLGSPGSFERSARECGLEVIAHSVFSDHHPFTVPELEAELAAARMADARLATTAKDAIRMENLPMRWTEDQRPIIIQLGLKLGDGSVMLNDIIKPFLCQDRRPENEIPGGRTSS